jgi:hypothetical protein
LAIDLISQKSLAFESLAIGGAVKEIVGICGAACIVGGMACVDICYFAHG